MTALTGDGGIGKTALASDLFYRLKGEGWQVGWVQCNRRLTEEILQISVSEEMGDVEERRRQILDWLESEQEKVCLFFDNVDRTLKNEERKLLDRIHPSIKVVVTTRQGSEGIGFEKDEMIAVPAMPLEEARELFYKYYSRSGERENDGVIDELISMAGGNTLLIELTARAASVEGGTLKEFADNIRNRPLQSISKAALRTAHLGKYGEDVETLTILQELLRMYSVVGMGEEERRILRLFSIMPENTEIWYKVREWADLDINAMKKLTDLGWLRQSDFGYEIHGIIKASLQVQWVEKGLSGIRREDYGRLVDELGYSDYFDLSEGYSVVRKRLALPVAVARHVWDDKTQYSRDLGYVFDNIGNTYGDLGDYRQALEYKKKALTIRGEVLSATHPDLAKSYCDLSITLIKLEKKEEALYYALKAQRVWKLSLPPEHKYHRMAERLIQYLKRK